MNHSIFGYYFHDVFFDQMPIKNPTPEIIVFPEPDQQKLGGITPQSPLRRIDEIKEGPADNQNS